MQRNLVEAIRQQSDDLRDELKDLELWEEEMEKAEAARRSRPQAASTNTVEPPIRGTVASIKQAIAETARKEGKQLAPEQDPIHIAKEKGNEYFRLGKISEATEAYTAGINLDPHGSDTHILYGNRAMCHLKTMQWTEAERDATVCLQLNRSYAKGYFRRAMARKNLGKLKEARADLEAVLALAPEDDRALAELDVVTKMIQIERSKAGAAPATKKRIAIEEVDEEDEDEDEEGTHAKEQQEEGEALSPEEQQLRDGRISAQLAELEQARRQGEEKARLETLRAEQAMEARRRRNVRVEVMEEDEDEEEAVKAKPSPPSQAPFSGARPAVEKGAEKRADVHRDPAHVGTSTAEAAPPLTGTKAPAPAASTREGSSPTAPTRAPRVRSLPSKESLSAPKTFVEFERVFPELEKDEALRNHYVSLMNPAGLPALFGSKMSPEMLVGILQSVGQFSGSVALQFLKGLSNVSRIEDLTLFFNADEKKLVEGALNLAKAAGATEMELSAIQRKLKPF